MIEEVLAGDGIPFLGWRDVPVNPGALGPTALASCPVIRQVLVGRPALAPDEDAWERALYLARREMERRAEELNLPGFYACSLSCRTVVYKALLTGTQLSAFYTDFRYPEYESAIAVFHQRYSTNTLPSWPLAQPFRLLAHNGEINTLWGNRNAMTMRQPMLSSPVWGAKIERLREVIWREGSDSASLDNAMELLVRSGRDPVHTAMMMVPQAWEKYPDLDPAIKAFYEYHQCVLEPWDGPAAIAFTDGVLAAAAVDRNGLRPCRYKVRRDGLVVAGSEVGVVDLDPREVVECGKVGPGEVLVVDTARGEVIRNLDAKREIAGRRPYARWVARYMATLVPDPARVPPVARRRGAAPPGARLRLRRGGPPHRAGADGLDRGRSGVEHGRRHADPAALGRAPERLRLLPAALRAGDQPADRPAAGVHGDVAPDAPGPARLAAAGAALLRPHAPAGAPDSAGRRDGRAAERGRLLHRHARRRVGRVEGRGRAQARAHRAPARRRAGRATGRAGHHHQRPHRRRAARADSRCCSPIGAVRQHLVHTGLRARVGLVAEAGDALDIHHFATLIGYGAEAVHPWLALAAVREAFGKEEGHRGAGRKEPAEPRPSPDGGGAAVPHRGGEGAAQDPLEDGDLHALLVLRRPDLRDPRAWATRSSSTCFSGTASPIGGIGFEEIAEDVLARHRAAYAPAEEAAASLPDHGRVRFRKDGEDHGWAPPIVVALQQAVKSDGRRGLRRLPGEELRPASRGPARSARGASRATAVPLDEVEPADVIRRRFVSSAMSLGALSPEAHATLSIAMNRMGARSNSGEGGEDPHNYLPADNGDRADNRIKQVASARFGVTTEYLVRAEELEIKIVQGAKPGEGGQLPAHKVTELIARLRHAVPGIQLISPPPHHDIYSIEDLAQLIHDLKTVNPRARVGREAGLRGRGGHRGGRRGQGVRRLRAHRRATTAAPARRRSPPSSTPARPGSSAWRRRRPSCSGTGCGTGSRSAPTAGSRPAATWSSRRCSARRATASAPRRWWRWGAPWRGSATSTPAPPASPPSARTCAPSSRARRSR